MSETEQDDRLMLEPGIHYDISWEDYLRCPYMSPSKLKHGRKSARRLKRVIDGMATDLQPSRKTVGFGSALHALVSGEIETRFAVMPAFEKDEENMTGGKTKSPPAQMLKKDGSLSSAGAKWREFLAEQGLPEDHDKDVTYDQRKPEPNKAKLTGYYKAKSAEFYEQCATQGKEVLSEQDVIKSKVVLKEMYQDELIARFLRDTKKEVTVVAEIMGLRFKSRLDFLSVEKRIVGDLKTMQDITNYEWKPQVFRQCDKMNYWFQFGMHSLLLEFAPGGFLMGDYTLLLCEADGDLDVGITDVCSELIEQGRKQVMNVIKKYSDGKRTGEWPGVFNGYQPMVVPNYAMKTEDDLEYVAVPEGDYSQAEEVTSL